MAYSSAAGAKDHVDDFLVAPVLATHVHDQIHAQGSVRPPFFCARRGVKWHAPSSMRRLEIGSDRLAHAVQCHTAIVPVHSAGSLPHAVTGREMPLDL